MTFDPVPYLPFLQRLVSQARLEHSLGVMNVMGELAQIYGLDPDQSFATGLLHDAARDLSLERQLAIAAEGNLKFDYPCEKHPVYLHAPAGALLVSRELGIQDKAVLDAISQHSNVGERDGHNSLLSRCLRIADILAPVQEWLGMRKLRDVVYAGKIEEATLLRCGWLIEFFGEVGIPIHPNITREVQTLAAKLDVDKDFFRRW
jgi:predicted HD superfamily hydrolase involved in NAD metabolism